MTFRVAPEISEAPANLSAVKVVLLIWKRGLGIRMFVSRILELRLTRIGC